MSAWLRHPYIDRPRIETPEDRDAALGRLNQGRGQRSAPAVEATYYLAVGVSGRPLGGLEQAARMILEHGTAKTWDQEAQAGLAKPDHYDSYLAWALDIGLYAHDPADGTEDGCLTLAYPLAFFDKADQDVPLAQLLMACASEPTSALAVLRCARLVDLRLPAVLTRRLTPGRWPNRRVRAYLGLPDEEPIIGTIVKPKTGLTPELFARAVVEAATAGARFTKADENSHLSRREIGVYVGAARRGLEREGFDLSPGAPGSRPRFLFAPHLTSGPEDILERCRIAVDSGANALMFSPYYAGGFGVMRRVAAELDVPIYAHTAGMNQMTGCWTWGFDPSIMYQLASRFGAAFMQITCVGSYLRPLDVEKPHILRRLEEEGLAGEEGMTLVVAGGLGPHNIGRNMAHLGGRGRMYLAGSSIYAHPDGPGAGVRALIAAWRAYREEGITEREALEAYAARVGAWELERALERTRESA